MKWQVSGYFSILFVLIFSIVFHNKILWRKQKTSRERPKSAPYLRLKKLQGTIIENIWKIFFSKKNMYLKVILDSTLEDIENVSENM